VNEFASPRHDALKGHLDHVGKKLKGRARLKRASEVVMPYYILRRPCGIIALDVATGGGLPAGGLVEIIGRDGCCKSYLLNRYMRRQQEIFGRNCFLAVDMTEMQYDKTFAKMHELRVALSEIEIEREQDLQGREFTEDELAYARDQVGEFFVGIGNSAEDLYDLVLAQVASMLYNIIGIDSWGSLLTKEEDKKGMHDKTRGGSAKVNTEFLRRFHAAMLSEDEEGMPNLTTVIGVNQWRERMGPGGGLNIQGGYALKHGKFVSIKLTAHSPIWRNAKGEISIGKSDDDGGKKATKTQVGKVIRWKLLKGKAGCHDGPEGEFHYYYATGVDTDRDLIITAQKCAVVITKGSWLSFGKLKAQGVDNWVKRLDAEPDLRLEMERAVLEAYGVTPNYYYEY